MTSVAYRPRFGSDSQARISWYGSAEVQLDRDQLYRARQVLEAY
jgi:hypothetical protein